MIAFLATWHNGHILWIRLIQKAARRNMVFCLGQAAAICTIIVQPAVAIICFIRIHCYYNSPKSSIIQNRVQSYKKNMNYARGKCIFCAKNVKKYVKFNEMRDLERKMRGEFGKIGGSGKPIFRFNLNAIDKADKGDLHGMQGEWTK